MRHLLMILLAFGLSSALFGQTWEVVKQGEMEYKPNNGYFLMLIPVYMLARMA